MKPLTKVREDDFTDALVAWFFAMATFAGACDCGDGEHAAADHDGAMAETERDERRTA